MPRIRYTLEEEQEDIAEYQAGATLLALANKRGLCLESIRNMLKRNDISRRPQGNSIIKLPESVKTAILVDRDAGMTQEAIARKHGVSQIGVSRYLSSTGRAKRVGKLRRGGKWKDSGGYMFVWCDPESPYASMTLHQGAIPEHRLVMAQHLGRPLSSKETVHHKDGNRANNVIDNLELRQGKHGKGVRHRCADCGSINVIPY